MASSGSASFAADQMDALAIVTFDAGLAVWPEEAWLRALQYYGAEALSVNAERSVVMLFYKTGGHASVLFQRIKDGLQDEWSSTAKAVWIGPALSLSGDFRWEQASHRHTLQESFQRLGDPRDLGHGFPTMPLRPPLPDKVRRQLPRACSPLAPPLASPRHQARRASSSRVPRPTYHPYPRSVPASAASTLASTSRHSNSVPGRPSSDTEATTSLDRAHAGQRPRPQTTTWPLPSHSEHQFFDLSSRSSLAASVAESPIDLEADPPLVPTASTSSLLLPAQTNQHISIAASQLHPSSAHHGTGNYGVSAAPRSHPPLPSPPLPPAQQVTFAHAAGEFSQQQQQQEADMFDLNALIREYGLDQHLGLPPVRTMMVHTEMDSPSARQAFADAIEKRRKKDDKLPSGFKLALHGSHSSVADSWVVIPSHLQLPFRFPQVTVTVRSTSTAIRAPAVPTSHHGQLNLIAQLHLPAFSHPLSTQHATTTRTEEHSSTENAPPTEREAPSESKPGAQDAEMSRVREA